VALEAVKLVPPLGGMCTGRRDILPHACPKWATLREPGAMGEWVGSAVPSPTTRGAFQH
jgi:hypothetical protein